MKPSYWSTWEAGGSNCLPGVSKVDFGETIKCLNVPVTALAESLRVSMVKCVVLTRTVNCNAIWIIDSLLVPSQWLCKWNVPGARLSEIHPGGFISLIRFSLVISYANTLAPGDMGTQPSSGDQYIYIIQILLREVRGAETLPPALHCIAASCENLPPFSPCLASCELYCVVIF